MYLLDIVGIYFEGVRDSLLLLICCYTVVLVFGEEPSFSPTCLLCQHFWDSFCFVFLFFFWVLLLLSSFVEVYFLFCLFSSFWVAVTSLLSGRAGFLLFMSWLVVCASRFRCCHFVVNLVGGLVGRANREGSIYFLPFFIIGVFGRKRVLPSGKRVFFARLWL